MFDSQIQLTVRLHMSGCGACSVTRARPASTSIAASAMLRSTFQDAIRRLHTSDAAWPNKPRAVSDERDKIDT